MKNLLDSIVFQIFMVLIGLIATLFILLVAAIFFFI
jgi:hypothetical protein